MTEKDAESILLAIINEVAPKKDTSDLDPEARLREQLGLDSLDFLDIFMELRERYHVHVPEKDYPKLATLGSFTRYLKEKLVVASPNPAG